MEADEVIFMEADEVIFMEADEVIFMEADEAEPLDIGSQAEPGNQLYHSDTTGNDINYWRVLLVNPPLPYWVIDRPYILIFLLIRLTTLF